jgi:hypothetical protein
METAITYRPLAEWAHDELIHLEEELWGGWTVDEIDFDAMRQGEGSDGFGAAPNYATWLEHFITEVDRLLTDAGYPKVPAVRLSPTLPGRSWRRSLIRVQVLEGGGSA